MSLNRKIRKYAQGILLVILAGFIFTAISTLVENIPESKLALTTVTVSTTTTASNYTLTLIKSLSYSATLSDGTSYCTTFGANLDAPSQGYKYLVIFPKPSTPLKSLYAYDKSGTYYSIPYSSNETHVYGFIEGKSVSTIYVCVSSTPYYTGNVYIYNAPASLTFDDLNPVTVTVTSTVTVTELSNKTVLVFIVWVSSVALIITALHKFDIRL